MTGSDSGWLVYARKVPSPNFDSRPGAEINLLIIHGISLPPGEFGGAAVARLFCNCLDPGAHECFSELAGLHVSTHLYINRLGDLVQFVPLHKRAWHAGVSCFGGCQNCNDFSIGIELEGVDDRPYTDAQYSQLAQVTADLQTVYPAITAERIVGHSDVAPGRKTDPGDAFDWTRYRGDLHAPHARPGKGTN